MTAMRSKKIDTILYYRNIVLSDVHENNIYINEEGFKFYDIYIVNYYLMYYLFYIDIYIVFCKILTH